MRLCSGVDVTDLSRFGKKRHPSCLGVAFLIVIEVTVTASFIVSYFYLRGVAPGWPPAGVDPPDLLWPSVNLVLLLCSAATMWWAGWGINRHNQTILVIGVGSSRLLATIVLVLRAFQFDDFTYSWDSHAYGSIVWTITGFHFVHVASAVVGTGAVTLLAMRGYFTRERQLGVVVDTLYWYFVAVVWIPFYLVLYWVPRFS